MNSSNSARKLNQEFLERVKQALPAGTNMVKVIETELQIGREGIYRRIRGDVPFTFGEVMALCLKFGISLDDFLGITRDTSAVFDLNQIDAADPFSDYLQMLDVETEMFKEFNRDPDSRILLGYNQIPFLFLARCETLWRFALYRLLHQLEKVKRIAPFSGTILPAELYEARDRLLRAYDQVRKIEIVLDMKIFSSVIKEIRYFHQLGFLKASDLHLLKKELLGLLDELELIMVSGKQPQGGDLVIYLSNIDLESSYCCYLSADMNFTHVRLYRLSVLNSSSPRIFDIQLDYVESLKRYSTLVTGSGELERNLFLKEQRNLIRRLE